MTSISTTISQIAAQSPIAAAAVNNQATKSALLYSLQSGDAATGSLLGEESTQGSTISQLLASASHPYLGQNLDIQA